MKWQNWLAAMVWVGRAVASQEPDWKAFRAWAESSLRQAGVSDAQIKGSETWFQEYYLPQPSSADVETIHYEDASRLLQTVDLDSRYKLGAFLRRDGSSGLAIFQPATGSAWRQFDSRTVTGRLVKGADEKAVAAELARLAKRYPKVRMDWVPGETMVGVLDLPNPPAAIDVLRSLERTQLMRFVNFDTSSYMADAVPRAGPPKPARAADGTLLPLVSLYVPNFLPAAASVLPSKATWPVGALGGTCAPQVTKILGRGI